MSCDHISSHPIGLNWSQDQVFFALIGQHTLDPENDWSFV